jgi:hypothetical protein
MKIDSSYGTSAAFNGTTTLSAAASTQNVDSQPFFALGGYGQPGSAGSQPWGLMNEVLIFSTLTTTQRQQVEGYLSWKWGLMDAVIPSPLSIPGLQIWMDGADLSTMTFSGTSNVTNWTSKGSSVFTMSNNGAGYYPVYTPGLGMYFSNTSPAAGSAATAPGFTYTGGLTIPTQSFSAIISIYALDSANYRNSVYISSMPGCNAVPNIILAFENGNSGYSANNLQLDGPNGNFTGHSVGTQYTTLCNTLRVDEIISAPSSVIMTVNDANVTFNVSNSYTSPYTNFPVTEFTIGNSQLYYGGRLFYGYVQEVLLYTSALTTAQRSSVKTYLARKWGNANMNSVVALPVAHPNYYIAPSARLFNPPDIGGCVLWLDGSDTTTFTFSSGSNISNWNDKSGLSNNATAYNSPVLTANAINGKQAISTSNLPYFTGSVSVTGTTVTIFCVATTTRTLPNTASDQRLVSLENGANVDYGRTDGVIGLFNQSSSSWIGTWRVSGPIASNAIVTNTPFLAVSKYDGTNGYLWLNGVAGTRASSASTGTFAVTKYGIGNQANPSGEYWQGFIGEVIIYSNALSDTERQQVEGYLAWKWNANGTLPATHPSFNFPTNTALPFIPSDVATCALWLDSAGPSSTNFVLSGTTITKWVDKSGNGRSLGNPSGTVSYITGGGVQLGGSLYVANAIDLTTFTFFIVAKSTSATANQTVFCAKPAGGNPSWSSVDGFGFYMDGQTAIRLYGQSGAGQFVGYSATTSSTSLFSFQSSGTSVSGWFNGVSQTGGTMTTTRTGTALGFALGLEWQGTVYGGSSAAIVYEIIVYNGVITTQARQIIEGYLAQKWKI